MRIEYKTDSKGKKTVDEGAQKLLLYLNKYSNIITYLSTCVK